MANFIDQLMNLQLGTDITGSGANQAPAATDINTGANSALNFNNVMASIDAISKGIGAYTGLRQLSLAKDSFNFNKGLAQTNLSNQAQTVNTQLEDRQRARIASNPNAYQSLSEYMSKNAVSGRIGG